MNEYQTKLSHHLKFLKTSCNNYDGGLREEALRIAVSLRVIFYDSGNSKSILSHLKKKKEIKLISTFDTKSLFEKMGIKTGNILPLMITSRGVKPPLDDWGRRTLFTVKEWLEEIIWKEKEISLSRWDIINSAANQDGGAHVDSEEKLSPETQKARQGLDCSGSRTVGNKTFSLNFKNHHFPLLRQFAHEVLISRELSDLAAD